MSSRAITYIELVRFNDHKVELQILMVHVRISPTSSLHYKTILLLILAQQLSTRNLLQNLYFSLVELYLAPAITT